MSASRCGPFFPVYRVSCLLAPVEFRFLVYTGVVGPAASAVGPQYADVVFLVDSSDHLGVKSFPFVKTFITRMISSLPIEASKYRVALARYSDKLYHEFHLNTFKSRNPMLNHLKKNFGFIGGSLRVGNALREAHGTYFSAPANGRDKKLFPPVLVVLASAESEDDVEEAAKALRKDGVKIVSVGIQKAPEENLRAMATAQFHYSLRTARDLSTFSQNMTQILGEVTRHREGAADDILVEVCQGPSVADVVFLLDVSINGSQENFDYLKEFLEESISALDIKEHCMRVGLVAYSNVTKVISPLSGGRNKSEVLLHVQSLAPQAGDAHTGAALRKVRKEVFSAKNGSRKNQGVPQIAVLVTHRASEDNVTKAAASLRREGVTIFTMGIEGASDTQLEKIASHPAEQYVSKLKTFSDLAAHNQTFLKKLRNQITHTVSVVPERTETLKSGCVDTEEADIYLLIDGSGHTQATDFQEMKTFLADVVGMFDIAPHKVRVGAVQYADSGDLEFEISKYSNKQDLGKAIENIRQMGGGTNTGAALNFTLSLLQRARQQRGKQVPCHLVVLTSGVSRDSVVEPARRLRAQHVRVHAIGVKEANQTQLREMAGEERRVRYVHDFDALKDIRNQVVQEICAEEACKEMRADIMFLVDSSGSIGLENFSKMKTFMKNLVSKSQVGADRVQVGVVQFSHINQEEFQLDRFLSQGEVSAAIDRMAHIGETTLTGSALTFMSQYFRPAKGARPNVKKFLILITDGEAQDVVKEPAAALRQEGVIIYSVGVFGSNVTQLEEISGRPEMVFYVENFDILQHIEDDLVFGICSPREECKRIEVLDVVFVIDSSGSIDHEEYTTMKDFMIGLVKKADVGRNQVRFGALKYADDPEVLFYLDDLGTKSEVISVLQNDQPMGGNTYTAEALGFSDHMFTEARGSRLHRGVPQVLIVITDGESHDAEKLNATAKALRDKGILVLAVGIAGANQVELLAMAGSRDKYFFVETFGGLKGIFSNVSDSVCNSSKVDCEIEKVDLVFLMDGSNSIHPSDFQKMKEFLASVVQDFDVTLNRVRVGVAQFSHTYRPEFLLGAHTGGEEVSARIAGIQQIFGYTHIGAALWQVGHYFRPDAGSRINAGTPQVLLVLTDGQSQDDVAQAAEDLRRRGVDIYTVGIGDVDDQQLVQITGTAEKKLTVHDFDELRKVRRRIVRNICTAGGESNCFMDVVVGFDVSTQQKGQTLLEGQSWTKTNLQDTLRAISSLNGVSCEVGTEIQVSVAFHVTNAMEKYSPKFEIYSEDILNSLAGLTVRGPSLLDTNHLSSLWDAFQNKSAARGKVVLLFSDGLDDDIEKLEQKSDELRKEGLNALLTVALNGAAASSDLGGLVYIEFGKGFEYRTQFTIDMRDLGSQLSKHLVNVAERTCCCVFCKCTGGDGSAGDPGPPGKRGPPGLKGSEGYLGEEGIAGTRGLTGQQGESGLPGRKGEKGDDGSQGDDGSPGYGGVGSKGAKEMWGPVTPSPVTYEQESWLTLRGVPVVTLLSHGDRVRFRSGCRAVPRQIRWEKSRAPQCRGGWRLHVMVPPSPSLALSPGALSAAAKGQTCELLQYVRDHSPGGHGFPRPSSDLPMVVAFRSAKVRVPAVAPGLLRPRTYYVPGPVALSACPWKPECPVHPTELVFVLDQSRDVTQQEFERMKGLVAALVRGLRVRENSCPVGARVAVLSYDSHPRHLLRFSDAHRKDQLLREIQAIPYERASGGRDIGRAMRFISRNVFKRTLPGTHTRRIATFFSSGPSSDAQAVTTAAMEFSALDIVPVVITFSNVPSVKRSFAGTASVLAECVTVMRSGRSVAGIDDTGTFQVIVVPSGADPAPALERLQRCTFCYGQVKHWMERLLKADTCQPDASCDQARPPPVPSYVDAAFLLDASRHVGSADFEDIRGFLGALLDHFEVAQEPETSVTGDRVALLSHAPPDFLPNTRRSPVRAEFNLTTYGSKRLMKRHVRESVRQLHGDAFVGHALRWTLDNVFSSAPNVRRNKVIFVISAGETSHLDGDTLKKESLRAKCQGYALFVLSIGPAWNDQELEDLASPPLDHHLVQLGRIHKPDHKYGVKFVKSFISSVRPPVEAVLTSAVHTPVLTEQCRAGRSRQDIGYKVEAFTV
ncbi:Collagen alpha-6(VI) chain [Tupaia chinensis]|uniref:Collagen alpha-6(VI) chain n=1 Tax=Tupaia chinensis TaxID=246437 RepID=L9JD33_TUPCH|nr:Collagen alpha-6(VI) chain [Tupaia chinensis]